MNLHNARNVKRECETCRYHDADMGQCRRRAPFPVQGAPNDKPLWPHVFEDDWCGQWKAKSAFRMEPEDL